MTIWVTSDTHFRHANIIKYCSRPFDHAHHMDTEMIHRWNSVVESDDEVWHLGDVEFKNGNLDERFAQLNGRVFLIQGNHDKTKSLLNSSVTWARGPLIKEPVYGRRFWLDHYPPNKTRGIPPKDCIVLAGHIHSSTPVHFPTSTYYTGPWIDVGVDAWDYTPVRLESLIDLWDQEVIGRSHSENDTE